MVGGGGDDAVFEEGTGGEAEDANGFDTDVVIGRIVHYGGVGIVGNGAGENVGGAAAGVSDANERNFNRLEAAVEIEIETSELAGAEFVVDAHAGVDFFAGVAVGFEAVFGFEKFDLGGVFFAGGGGRGFGRLGRWGRSGGECLRLSESWMGMEQQQRNKKPKAQTQVPATVCAARFLFCR